MKTKALMLSLALTFSSLASADVVIIVHPSNETTLTEGEIKNIFLGKLNSFSNGSQAIAISLTSDSGGFDHFLSALIGRSPAQWKSYWANKAFTGEMTPPRQVNSSEMISLIATNPNLIGFVEDKDIPSTVKIIHKL